MGQLFHRHAGAKRRNKPQDRIVKVTFHHSGKPKEISWGSGSRFIEFKDISYVSWGIYTPVLEARKSWLEPKRCFSVVAGDKILDLEGYNQHLAELWVRGLRKLIGHTDEKSDNAAQSNMKNLLNDRTKERAQKLRDKQKITNIIAIQQDLFIMSTHTVFRHLDEERIWNIDEQVRERFGPQKMYQIALKKDIPWRQWQHWIREQVTTYLRENNLMHIAPKEPQYAYPHISNNVQSQPQPQPMYHPQYQPPYQPQLQPQYQPQPQYQAPPSYQANTAQYDNVNNSNDAASNSPEEDKCSLM
eukprot:308106_1